MNDVSAGRDQRVLVYSHSHRGFSPVSSAVPDFSNRFNGLEFAEWLRLERKPLKRFRLSEFALTPG